MPPPTHPANQLPWANLLRQNFLLCIKNSLRNLTCNLWCIFKMVWSLRNQPRFNRIVLSQPLLHPQCYKELKCNSRGYLLIFPIFDKTIIETEMMPWHSITNPTQSRGTKKPPKIAMALWIMRNDFHLYPLFRIILCSVPLCSHQLSIPKTQLYLQ